MLTALMTPVLSPHAVVTVRCVGWTLIGHSNFKIQQFKCSNNVTQIENGRPQESTDYQLQDAEYVGGSKIFRTGAAICTAVVLAPSTDKW